MDTQQEKLMTSRAFSLFLPVGALMLFGCDGGQPVEPTPIAVPSLAKGGPNTASGFATLAKLPPIKGGGHGEAYAVDQAGSVIAGYSWDREGRMNPVTWTLQNGAWTVTPRPYPATATSAVVRAINDQGDLGGNDFPGSNPHPVLWAAGGGFSVLGCGDTGEVRAMSSGGQTLAGRGGPSTPGIAALWHPNGCREDLPLLVAGGYSNAYAINGDATVVGGSASLEAGNSVPVRWTRSNGAWQVEQLDSRPGAVTGSNPAGDLAGFVQVSCASASSCNRGIIWYAGGGSRELPTLGGGSTSPRAINAAREVVGLSSLSNGNGTAFIWSETAGMRQLPVSGGAWAFAISAARTDGTRLVAGAGGQPFSALVWVVR
jgi:probable HAF family extracellular repeat protein